MFFLAFCYRKQSVLQKEKSLWAGSGVGFNHSYIIQKTVFGCKWYFIKSLGTILENVWICEDTVHCSYSSRPLLFIKI
jgi:hypothetical protein